MTRSTPAWRWYARCASMTSASSRARRVITTLTGSGRSGRVQSHALDRADADGDLVRGIVGRDLRVGQVVAPEPEEERGCGEHVPVRLDVDVRLPEHLRGQAS